MTPRHPLPPAPRPGVAEIQGVNLALARAALLSGPAAVESFELWQGRVDLDRLPPGHYALLHLLADNLERLGLEHPWLPTLRGISRKRWSAGRLLARELPELAAALSDRGISCVLASAPAPACHPAAAQRLPWGGERLILVVPPGRARAAIRVLLDRNMTPASPRCLVPGYRLFRNAAHFAGGGAPVELRWHFLDRKPTAELDAAFRAQTLDQEAGCSGLRWAPLLLRACLASRERGPGRVSALAEAALVLRAGHDLDWSWLTATASRFRLAGELLTALETLSRYLNAHLPAAVAAALREEAP